MVRRSNISNGQRFPYQEVIFSEPPDATHNRVTKIIRHAESIIKQNNAIPVFSTVTPSSIKKWNRTRLHQHKTSYLLHFNKYEEMQDRLIEAIIKINQTIHSINSKNNVITPKLGQAILYKRRGTWRKRYGKLVDGVHPNNKIKAKWVMTMDEVMAKNEHKYNSPVTPNPPILIEIDSDSDTDSEAEGHKNWLY